MPSFHVPLIVASALPFLGFSIDLSNAKPLTFDLNSSKWIWSILYSHLVQSRNFLSDTLLPILFLKIIYSSQKNEEFHYITFVAELQLHVLPNSMTRIGAFQTSCIFISDTIDTSEQNDSPSDSSSLWITTATADALALALTDEAAFGSLPLKAFLGESLGLAAAAFTVAFRHDSGCFLVA